MNFGTGLIFTNEHCAREYVDDTNAFLADLKKGESISLLIAPSFRANYPDEYERVLGGLRALGVKRMINVAFGADISTWGYIKYIKERDLPAVFPSPCPQIRRSFLNLSTVYDAPGFHVIKSIGWKQK